MSRKFRPSLIRTDSAMVALANPPDADETPLLDLTAEAWIAPGPTSPGRRDNLGGGGAGGQNSTMMFFPSTTEPALVAHHYTDKERHQMEAFESLDYWESRSLIYRNHILKRRSEHRWSKWIVYLLIGVSVGFWAFIVFGTIRRISDWKRVALEVLFNQPAAGYFAYISISVVCAGLASAMCLVFPAAAGSGVPDVMAYLNGVSFPKVFNIRTLLVKSVSNILAVSSGLPVGAEGPMIHLGALIGAGMSSGRTRLLPGKSISFLQTFRNTKDSRDFIGAGAAAGVSAAFRAPVGGLLFVMEEVASFFPVKLAWMTFLCCLMSVFTINLCNSYFDGWIVRARSNTPDGQILATATVLFDITKRAPINVYLFFPTILLSLICGIFAVLFTTANLRIVRFRARHIAPNRLFKVLEPMVIVFIFASISFVSSQLFDCQPKLPEYKSSNNGTLPLFEAGCKNDDYYNPYGSLALVPSDEAITVLFSRGTATMFLYGPVVFWFVLYTVFACWSGGVFLAGGIVIPTLMIGALAGRVIGHATHDFMTSQFPSETIETVSWSDPGLLALIGAAAFFGGLSRLTFSLTIIMLELSSDLHQIIFIACAIVIAKSVADRFTHSLYHGLLEVKCVPFLDFDAQVHKLDVYSAKSIMAYDVKSLRSIENISVVLEILKSCKHNGFPVICNKSRTFKGLILRSHLETLLWYVYIKLTNDDGSRKTNMSITALPPADFRMLQEITEQLFWQKKTGLPDLKWLLEPPQLTEGGEMSTTPTMTENNEYGLNLNPYMDTSHFVVSENTCISRVYYLFRSLGLRHLVIVNDTYHVVGIITRKDLVSGNLEDRLKQARFMEMSQVSGGGGGGGGDGNHASEQLQQQLSPTSQVQHELSNIRLIVPLNDR